MSLEKLLRDRMISRVVSNPQQVSEVFRVAERDLVAARNSLREGDFDWALAIAYNSMLQAGRALMLKRGFRPVGEFKHVAVVEFVKVEFSDELSGRLAFAFGKIRRKRHRVVYEEAGVTTEREASEVIGLAEEFVDRVRVILKGNVGEH
jgi:uncharacterized protein (UPF0332 family)